MANASEFDPLFLRAVALVLRHEGGYVKDGSDPGGETKFGICKKTYPELDIAALTRDEAVAIYHRDWWAPHRYGELPPDLACKVFDLAVNLGPRTVALVLQNACAECGQDIAPDGAIGARTLAAAKACDEAALLAAFKLQAANHYQDLAARHPALRRYLAGWLARVND